jgi:hypothetical protein
LYIFTSVSGFFRILPETGKPNFPQLRFGHCVASEARVYKLREPEIP